MTHKGVPDFPRSARCILKDYVNVSGYVFSAFYCDCNGAFLS